MANFMEELWSSIFTPGPTPTLLVATNVTFAALQLLLLVLLIATYSIHFIVLSFLCAGLWYSINWFATELQIAQAKEEAENRGRKEKSPDPGSDTETEGSPPVRKQPPAPSRDPSTMLEPKASDMAESLRRRRSLGDSSGYVSTDSDWEKVSEGDEKSR